MAASRGKGSISSTSCAAPSDPLVSDAPPQRAQLYGRKRGRPLRAGQQCLLENCCRGSRSSCRHRPRSIPRRCLRAPRRSVWLEIGFGGGEHLAAQAEAQRESALSAARYSKTGSPSCSAKSSAGSSTTSASLPATRACLVAALPPASIGRVFILFPDPWPKARHHKRRIVSTETLDELARVMTDAAELRLATDDRSYFSWMLERVTAVRPSMARPPPRRLAGAPGGPTTHALRGKGPRRRPHAVFLRARRHCRSKRS